MTRPVRIGVQLQPQHAPDYGLIRDAVLRSEDAGVDIVFNWDHFYPLTGDPDGAHFECWTMLGAWAEQTERVEIGALVTGGGYRNPDLLADMARTVDHMSGGRLILGIGAGWFQKDYDQFGYDFGTPGSRLKLLGEYLPRITRRLAGGNPPPTRNIPVLIGGGGEKKTLRLVAEYADVWHSFGDRETHLRKSDILADHCAAVGRNPLDVEHSAPWPGLENAADLVADGVTLFTVSSSGPDYDLTTLVEAIGWRDENTAPALSGLA
ncbi:LLM class F420-dependent oxidoreductase [Rhodococcus sp. AD45-ID]|uniref:LLM class F420-dependent oxidoreductase n=2 Tax=Nocardiaceae TaxID=85025 RepID=A0ABU4BZZ1_RHOGO|nr:MULTISPECIES: LLM class F420-dependent oxidoreductase [Rhodococcus]NMD63134.1 LLM class F420-dependent oxidoreductase [Nocardia globerula]KJF24791.1 Phthiodiolone/phenolphthiodiolone dimycocerosates ketoreductase [Rhodococcus sp. AD45]MCE4269038.1 LLM class F420-dependent oxidoreductase [Rhodococcus globerulus]MDV6269792.1 LLM class F420-dependent oxidoreductase [Rhodococcus globerulus]MDV8065460.1 LLM class F420-dependent oxidoreductase [Rhodococcus sp. IEGM 1366]